MGRGPVRVEKAICGAVARAARPRSGKSGKIALRKIRRDPVRVERRPVTCRLVLRLEVSQRADNRLVEAGEPFQIVAPVLDELGNQTVVLLTAPQTLVEEPGL